MAARAWTTIARPGPITATTASKKRLSTRSRPGSWLAGSQDPPCFSCRRRLTRLGSARGGTLGVDEDRVDRLARGHEQPIALGSAEADVGAHFGQTNPPDQLAGWVPYG